MEREKLVSLVTAAQNGDKNALNELFNAFYNDVYYFALKTVKDSDIACDITQETFVEIIKTINNLKEPAAFVTWMKQITYHQCTRYFKKKKDVLAEEDEEGNTVFDTLAEDKAEFIPDEALENEDFKNTILEIINGLKEDQRALIMLYYFEERSYSEISDITGLSVSDIKNKLFAARKSIKRAVENYEKKNNTKLHAIPFFPFIKWLFGTSKENMPLTAAKTAAEGISSATGTAVSVSSSATVGATAAGATASTAAAATATGIGAKIAALPVMTKIIAGALALAIASGGVFAATRFGRKNKNETPETSTPSMENATENSGTTDDPAVPGMTDISDVSNEEYISGEEESLDDSENTENSDNSEITETPVENPEDDDPLSDKNVIETMERMIRACNYMEHKRIRGAENVFAFAKITDPADLPDEYIMNYIANYPPEILEPISTEDISREEYGYSAGRRVYSGNDIKNYSKTVFGRDIDLTKLNYSVGEVGALRGDWMQCRYNASANTVTYEKQVGAKGYGPMIELKSFERRTDNTFYAVFDSLVPNLTAPYDKLQITIKYIDGHWRIIKCCFVDDISPCGCSECNYAMGYYLYQKVMDSNNELFDGMAWVLHLTTTAETDEYGWYPSDFEGKFEKEYRYFKTFTFDSTATSEQMRSEIAAYSEKISESGTHYYYVLNDYASEIYSEGDKYYVICEYITYKTSGTFTAAHRVTSSGTHSDRITLSDGTMFYHSAPNLTEVDEAGVRYGTYHYHTEVAFEDYYKKTMNN